RRVQNSADGGRVERRGHGHAIGAGACAEVGQSRVRIVRCYSIEGEILLFAIDRGGKASGAFEAGNSENVRDMPGVVPAIIFSILPGDRLCEDHEAIILHWNILFPSSR